MTQLLAVVALCGGLAVALHRKPLLGVSVALLLWAVIPGVAASRFTGQAVGPLALHPATWLALTMVGTQLVFAPEHMIRPLLRHLVALVAVAVFVVGAVLTTAVTGSGGLRLLGDQIVGPLALFWLVLAHAGREANGLRLLRNTVLAAATVNAAVGIAQALTGTLLVHEGAYPWFNIERAVRWMGMTDSYLVLSFLSVTAAPLLISVRVTAVRLSLLVVLVLGCLASQSRVGLAALTLVSVYLVLRADMRVVGRLGWSALLLVAGGSILASGFASGVTSRLTYDSGSSEARVLAWQAFTDRLVVNLITGEGLTANYRVAREAGLQTSLESSYLMYAVDTGVALATLYFTTQAVLIVRSLRGTVMPGVAVASGFGWAIQHTFSAVGFSNLCGAYLWVLVGMAVVSREIRTSGADDHHPSVRREVARR